MNLLLISCLIFSTPGPTVCCQTLKDEVDGKSFISTTKLWYEEPSSMWTDALPIGNGRLGGMVFGRTHEELIQLNENTVWASAPIYGAYWGSWSGAAAWFCDNVWDHYLFTGDTAYLKEYYYLIRDAALFFDQTLVQHPKYGWLVPNPSGSPKNGPGGDPSWIRNPDGTRNIS